jgi:hypothetical protein
MTASWAGAFWRLATLLSVASQMALDVLGHVGCSRMKRARRVHRRLGLFLFVRGYWPVFQYVSARTDHSLKPKYGHPIRRGILRWPIIAPSSDAVGGFTGELRPPK